VAVSKELLQPLSAERRALVEKILLQSERMVELAREEAWDELIALEPERRQQIERLFSSPPVAPESPALAAMIRTVDACDRETGRLVKCGKQSLVEGMRSLNSGQRAAAAYVAAGRRHR
jgi:hypothetical protein